MADKSTLPKGGGRDHVGKPYKVGGKTFHPKENAEYSRVGLASWYGGIFHGRRTANGEIFDKNSIAAAHPTLPLPSYVRVTNLTNSRSIIVRVNDRGPFHGNRLIDVSQRTADVLGFKQAGTARVRVDYIRRASIRGTDDRMLLATLTEGRPASLPGSAAPTAVAQAAPARPALAFRQPENVNTTQPPIQQVAFRAAAPSTQAASPVSSFATAPVPQSVRLVSNMPLPPERPFDLGTTKVTPKPAGSRGPREATRQEQRPIKTAALAYGAETPSRFVVTSAFNSVNSQGFVSFK
ncbi:septal ring lytic transglycosylase RlpA family protein [Chelatococcus sp. GCM10030263]|uniref:septal ring lytic transglycosylase RlpA family protein n=1 Tax=Chelatococcus sp. GCM10030263 TaxID=3273387 RepID=UPI003608DC2C